VCLPLLWPRSPPRLAQLPNAMFRPTLALVLKGRPWAPAIARHRCQKPAWHFSSSASKIPGRQHQLLLLGSPRPPARSPSPQVPAATLGRAAHPACHAPADLHGGMCLFCGSCYQIRPLLQPRRHRGPARWVRRSHGGTSYHGLIAMGSWLRDTVVLACEVGDDKH